MARNDPFTTSAVGVADGGDLIIDGTDAGTGAAEVTELFGTAEAELYREIDTDGDGTFDVSVKADILTGTWHTQLNEFVVSQTNNVRLRVNNTSGGTADFGAVGVEVDDA